MRKVLVVGAGAQGGPCTSILAGEGGISEIILGDINLELARNVANKVDAIKVNPVRLDASSKEDIVEAAKGVDVIINLTLLKFNDIIMEAAVAANEHYVDRACDTEFLKDWAAGVESKYHSEFIRVGKTALAGCGFAPGISNVLTRYVCDQLDRVEKITIRAGRGYGHHPDEVVSD